MEKYKSKKIIILIGIIMILIIINSTISFANTDFIMAVVLNVTPSEVKVGETFTVILNATCSDGINGITTEYKYDEEKLELLSATVGDSNFVNLGTDNKIEVICNSESKITNAEVYVLTFKAKEGTNVGSTAKISIEKGTLDSDAKEDSQHVLNASEATITVVEEKTSTGDEDKETTNPEEKPSTGDEDKETTNPDEKPSTGDEGKEEETTNPEEKPTTEGTTEGTTVTVGGEKDNTTANTSIPKAGINSIIIIAIIFVAGFAIAMYKKNKKYRDIK